MARKISQAEYFKRLEEIQQFVNFAYDADIELSKAQKAKISRYYNAIRKELFDVGAIYTGPRDYVAEVAAIIGSEIPRAGLKAVPVPTSLKGAKVKTRIVKRKVKTGRKTKKGKPIKRTIKRREVIIQAKNVTEKFITFDQKRLAREGRSYIEEILETISFQKGVEGKFFLYGKTFTLDEFKSKAKALRLYDYVMATYNNMADSKNFVGIQLNKFRRNIPKSEYQDYWREREAKKKRAIKRPTKRQRIRGRK